MSGKARHYQARRVASHGGMWRPKPDNFARQAIAIREPEGNAKAGTRRPTQAGRRGKSALTACVTVAEVDYAPIRWETQAAPGDYVAPRRRHSRRAIKQARGVIIP